MVHIGRMECVPFARHNLFIILFIRFTGKINWFFAAFSSIWVFLLLFPWFLTKLELEFLATVQFVQYRFYIFQWTIRRFSTSYWEKKPRKLYVEPWKILYSNEIYTLILIKLTDAGETDVFWCTLYTRYTTHWTYTGTETLCDTLYIIKLKQMPFDREEQPNR